MPQKCSDYISQLQDIKELQTRLNQEIEEFLSIKNSKEIGTEDKIEKFKDIYQIKKEIINSDLCRWRARKQVVEITMRMPLAHSREDITFALDYIEEKINNQEKLTRMEIVFLYEPATSQKGSDIKERIKKLKEIRNVDIDEDLPVIFECDSNQVIHNEEELREAIEKKIEVKIYSGDIFIGMFDLLPENVEWIYTRFPEGQIIRKEIELGTGLKNADDFLTQMQKHKPKIEAGQLTQDLLQSLDNFGAERKSKIKLVIMSVRDLGCNDHEVKFDKVYRYAEHVGLKKCPAEVGPQLCLQYGDMVDQPLVIGMSPNNKVNGIPYIFSVTKNRLAVYSRFDNEIIRDDAVIVFCV